MEDQNDSNTDKIPAVQGTFFAEQNAGTVRHIDRIEASNPSTRITEVEPVTQTGPAVAEHIEVETSPAEVSALLANSHSNGSGKKIPVLEGLKNLWKGLTSPPPHSNISSAVTEVSEYPDKTMAPDPRYPKR